MAPPPGTEEAADAVQRLAAALIAAPRGDVHRKLTTATARCLGTTLRVAHGSGDNGLRLGLRLVEALDGLLTKASERKGLRWARRTPLAGGGLKLATCAERPLATSNSS